MKNKSSRIGLDPGTSRIVVARRVEGEYQCQSHLNAFVAVPLTQMAARTLKKEGVLHMEQGAELLVYGNESERFADLFHLEARRPMRGGVLNPGEPEGIPLIRRILEALGAGGDEPRRVCFSVPASPLGEESTVTFHEAALKELLAELGHEARAINEGLAVIYSELEDSNYTGIGISFGGGLCNVCLAYLSAPLLSFSISKAGDFIDSSAAAVTNELATRVRIVKESSFGFNGHFAEKIQQALGIYYMDMIQAVVDGLHNAFSNALNVPKLGRAIPIVLSGGSALASGFRERFEKALADRPLPIPISEVRLAAEPLSATAKGALVAALAEM
ncbi:MAG: hypothetical protein IT159_09310 [Bryobacterales bacterium]|nr:hypothetical protein [Bryobacterales bacterium]